MKNLNTYGEAAVKFYDNYSKNIADNHSLSELIALNETETQSNIPLISVIIPTYNRKEMLNKAITSVFSQKYRNIEIIVIDDNSTDGTREYLLDIKKVFKNLKVITNEENKNAGLNRNLGYKKSKGKYIVFLDDDDYYIDNDFFAKAVSLLEKYSYLSFVAGNTFVEDIVGRKLHISDIGFTGMVQKEKYLSNFQISYTKPNSTFSSVFNRKILEDMDFNDMLMMNDSSIYLRALVAGDAYIMKEIIGSYVVHQSNISKNLNYDFILKNLDEKVWVARRIEKSSNYLDENWLASQVYFTLNYYISGSMPDINSLNIVINWVRNNIRYKKYITIIKLYKTFFVAKLKNR